MKSPGIVTLPKTSRLPAFVAGLSRVLIMKSPGIVTLPAAFTCFVAMPAKLSKIFTQSFLLISDSAATASAKPLLDKGVAPDFIAFIAFIALGAIVEEIWRAERSSASKPDDHKLEPK